MIAREALDRTVRLVRDAVPEEVNDDAIVEALQSFRVRIVVDAANASTFSGQTTVVTLVALIARMGIQIALDCPDVPIIGKQPPLRGTRLRTALIDFGGDIVPGTTVSDDLTAGCHAVLIVGDTNYQADRPAWFVTGTAWEGRIGRTGMSRRWDTGWPIGAMTAATLAASEIFKMAIRRLPLRQLWDEYLALCDFGSWDFAGEGLELDSNTLSVDVISAGAIAQAALYALFRLPLRLRLRIFDKDTAELSNVNRQALMRRSDHGRKVGIVEKVAPPNATCTAIPEHFVATTVDTCGPLAPYTLIGTDDIPARWVAQRCATAWLGVGATTHFETSTSSHAIGESCAGCLHPRDDDGPNVPIPTVSFVSFWAGLALVVRFLHEVAGKPYPPEQQHLWLSALRIGDPEAAWWSPVPGRSDCPVGCVNAQRAKHMAEPIVSG